MTAKFPSSQRFDAVVGSLVVEHISDLDGFFAKVSTLLKNGGSEV